MFVSSSNVLFKILVFICWKPNISKQYLSDDDNHLPSLIIIQTSKHLNRCRSVCSSILVNKRVGKSLSLLRTMLLSVHKENKNCNSHNDHTGHNYDHHYPLVIIIITNVINVIHIINAIHAILELHTNRPKTEKLILPNAFITRRISARSGRNITIYLIIQFRHFPSTNHLLIATVIGPTKPM